MLMYTACFWLLHYLPQQLSIISVSIASCLGAVTMDLTFPVPHWPRATLHPLKRKEFALCKVLQKLYLKKKITVKQASQPLQVWRVSPHRNNHFLKNAGIWILFISTKSCGPCHCSLVECPSPPARTHKLSRWLRGPSPITYNKAVN